MQTNIEDNVITLFRQKSIEKHENLTQQIVSRIFNERSEQIRHVPFKQEMLIELVNQCRCQKLELTPRGIGSTISQAHGILQRRLNVLRGSDGLIAKKQLDLLQLKQEVAGMSDILNRGFYQMQLKNQKIRESQNIQKQLEQLEKDQRTFTQEFQILDQLFRKNVPGKRKRDDDKNSFAELNPNNLVIAFYLSLVGIFCQFFAVLVRPGWTGMAIFLQALFLILIGYYHKKAVMFLILSGLTSILLDVVAIFMFQIFLLKHVLYLNTNDQIQKILNYVYIVAYIISIIARIGVVIACYSFVEPPIKKINYTIRNNSLTLNTRLRSNSVRGSLSIQAN